MEIRHLTLICGMIEPPWELCLCSFYCTIVKPCTFTNHTPPLHHTTHQTPPRGNSACGWLIFGRTIFSAFLNPTQAGCFASKKGKRICLRLFQLGTVFLVDRGPFESCNVSFLNPKACCLSMHNLEIISHTSLQFYTFGLFEDQLRERSSLRVLLCINARKIPSESLSKSEFEFAFMSWEDKGRIQLGIGLDLDQNK